ncbi:MAG TPA: AMP-binding protein, partial [Candidatus Obscuribacterales bacterium]
IEMGDLQLEAVGMAVHTATFDLTLSMAETPQGLVGCLDYSTELFEAGTIERMAIQLETLLEGAMADPDQRVNEIEILTKEEQQQLLVEWSGTQMDYSGKWSVLQLFEAQAEKQPEAPAVVYEGENLSYGELNRRANQLAHFLREHGVQPEARVGICFERSLEMVVGILGIMKAGGAYVPLDPGYPPERLNYMVKDARLKVLLTQEKMREQFQEHGLELVFIDKDWDDVARYSQLSLGPIAGPDNLVYLIYTPGSTGKPKGVAVTHSNLLHSTLARWSTFEAPLQRYLFLSSIAFDGLPGGLFWALAQGGSLHLPKQGAYSIPALVQQIAQSEITHFGCIPSFYDLLLREASPLLPACIKVAIVAGETCSPDLVRRHEQAVPHGDLFNEYGPAEATVWSTVYQHQKGTLRSPVPIGKPIANAQVYVLDEKMKAVPV